MITSVRFYSFRNSSLRFLGKLTGNFWFVLIPLRMLVNSFTGSVPLNLLLYETKLFFFFFVYYAFCEVQAVLKLEMNPWRKPTYWKGSILPHFPFSSQGVFSAADPLL